MIGVGLDSSISKISSNLKEHLLLSLSNSLPLYMDISWVICRFNNELAIVINLKQFKGNVNKVVKFLRIPKFCRTTNAKKTGAWKGRLKRFFVDLYPVELVKNGTKII